MARGIVGSFKVYRPSQARSAFGSRNPLLKVQNGEIAIEGMVNDPDAFMRTLVAIGATSIRGGGILFSARVPVDNASEESDPHA
jgi:hypothetical protein